MSFTPRTSGTATPEAFPPASMRWKIVGLMFAMSAVNYFDRIAMSIAGPNIMKDFQISEVAMGTVYSAFLLTYTLLMTVGGGLADRFGGRIVLIIAGLGSAIFTGLTAISGPSGIGAYFGVLPAFLIVRLGFGACAAPLYPSCGRLTAVWIPPGGQGRALSIVMSGAAVGAAVSPLVFSRSIAAFGWPASFWIAAAATAMLSIVWSLWMRGGRPGSPPPHRSLGGGFRTSIRDRQLLLLSGAYFALNYFQYIFYYWIYYYFGQVRHMGKNESALATTALFVTMAIMTPLGGWSSDRMVQRFGPKAGRRLIPVVAMSMSAILLFAGSRGSGVGTTVAILSLAVGFSMAPEGAFWSTAIHFGGRHAGAAGGIMNCGGNLGGMLAPVLTPLIASRFGWPGGLYFASFVVMVGMLIWFSIDPARTLESNSEVHAG